MDIALRPGPRRAGRNRPRHLGSDETHDEGSGLHLVFDCTQSQPDFAKLFLSGGGPINTAAAAGTTDFALTSATAAVKVQLDSHVPKTVQLDLPQAVIFKHEDGVAYVDHRTKINVSTQRTGAAINGTLVDTHAGAGSVYLRSMLEGRNGPFQVPLIYSSVASHSATLGCFGARVVDDEGEPVSVAFAEDPEVTSALALAEKDVDKWAHEAWDLREKHLVYAASPSLTKTVAKVPVGVNDKGYELVHNVVGKEFAFGLPALNSLLEHATGMELEYSAPDTAQFLRATERPGLGAAVWTQTVAAALSTIAAYLVAYRADGRTVMGARGAEFLSTENWLEKALRTPWEANDCDGSALEICAMIQAALDSTREERHQYPYVRAARNAIFGHYQFGVCVLGATAAEASGGGGNKTHVAGHAVAMLVPTLALLDGLDRAAGAVVAGRRVSSDPAALRSARLEAVYSPSVLAELPEDERNLIESGNLAGELGDSLRKLQPYVPEGTTPASPVLFLADAQRQADAARGAKLDEKAFALAAPNVARSVKILHVGASGACPHRFYNEFVELTLHSESPLFRDAKLRSMGHAASQFVFTPVPSHRSAELKEAGASPRQLVLGEFAAVPLHTVNEDVGSRLDLAGDVSRQDVIPPRAGVAVLSAAQSEGIKRSMAALRALDAKMPHEESTGHVVAYTLAFSTLVNNPAAVEHFCNRVGKVAVAGVVDFHVVSGLAVHPGKEAGIEAEDAGHFVVVNAVMEV